jgi:UDP-N-acetylglucosamine acyltransferase
MSNLIHPSAIIDPTATLGEGVEVGPFSIIGADVQIGANTQIGPHVVIEARTILGEHCEVSAGAVLGGPPQDLNYKGEPTRVRVGNHTKIRECVTLNRATGEGQETVVGNHCFLMAYSHLAHNCRTGDNVILANAVQVGGHVEIGDWAFLGGGSVVHQHCRIGRMAFLGGASASRQDLVPFSMNMGATARVTGINSIGLRRRGLNGQERQNLRKAFFLLWFSDLNRTQAIETIRETLTVDTYIEELIDFVLTSKRGVCRAASKSSSVDTDVQEPVGAL